MSSRNYRDLIVWQKAMELVVAIYETSRQWPREEIYGLTAQMRRAAISVPSNIAEGEGRGNKKKFVHFLRIAHGSLRELETQVLIGHRLSYITDVVAEDLATRMAEVGRLLSGLIRSFVSDTADRPLPTAH